MKKNYSLYKNFKNIIIPLIEYMSPENKVFLIKLEYYCGYKLYFKL